MSLYVPVQIAFFCMGCISGNTFLGVIYAPVRNTEVEKDCLQLQFTFIILPKIEADMFLLLETLITLSRSGHQANKYTGSDQAIYFLCSLLFLVKKGD